MHYSISPASNFFTSNLPVVFTDEEGSVVPLLLLSSASYAVNSFDLKQFTDADGTIRIYAVRTNAGHVLFNTGAFVSASARGDATDGGDISVLQVGDYKYTLNKAAIGGKLDKKIASLGKIKLYGVNGSTQNMYSAVAGSPDALTVVMRDSDGGAVFEQGTSLKSAVILDTIEPVVITPTTPKDTNGTISEDQLNRLLQGSLSSVNTKPGIFMNNEYYIPMDRKHIIGFLGYTHVGYVDSQFTVKNIKIDINAMTWELNTINIQPLLVSYNGEVS